MSKNDRLISCNREWTGIAILTKNGKRVFLDYSQIKEIRIGYYTITKLFSKKQLKR